MTSFSIRRLILACTVSVAAVAAVAAPGTASASDLGAQCSGSTIKGNGSSFQAPILKKWAEEFNTSGNLLACAGKEGQGSKGTPKVEYLSGGSGACLHGWGAESTETVKFGEFGYCGTDEAPNRKAERRNRIAQSKRRSNQVA